MEFPHIKAETLGFSYNALGEKATEFGYKKAETYDIAINISNPELTGKKISGLKVPLNGIPKNISGCKGWLSNELSAETLDNVSVISPDIITVEGIYDNGTLSVEFEPPYEIQESGLYVGYSFNIDEIGDDYQKPVAVVEGNTPGGLWMHSSISQKSWADMTKRNGIVSAMTVFLEGDFKKEAATPLLDSDLRIAELQKNNISVEVTNWGSSEISSIEYTYDVAGTTGTGLYTFPEPVVAELGRKGVAVIELDPVAGNGENTLTLNLIKVNGNDNRAVVPKISSPVIIQKFVPNYRPLVEEYTGLNCGWCPRGYVMLEEMKEKYGDEFVGISYHSDGWESSNAMVCIKETDFPLHPGSYPAASINRNSVVNPADIPLLWEKSYQNQTPAEVKVEWLWSNEDHTKLEAKAKVRFLDDIQDSNYRLAFIMLADGLSNAKWLQSNYYSDYSRSEEYSGPYWDLFIGTDPKVANLIFNDVAVHSSAVTGIEDSLPADIKGGEWYEYAYDVDVESITNLQGTHIVENFDMTRMIAVIVNRQNGKPLNCISSAYPDNGAFVEGISSDLPVKYTMYYDLQGRRTEKPAKGIYIKRDILEDGSVTIAKIII